MQESLLVYQTAGAIKTNGCKFSFLNNLFSLKYTELTCILYLELGSIIEGQGRGSEWDGLKTLCAEIRPDMQVSPY